MAEAGTPPGAAKDVMLHPEEVGRLATRIRGMAKDILDGLDTANGQPGLTVEDFGNLNADAVAYQLHAQVVQQSTDKARERGTGLENSAAVLAEYATAMNDNDIAEAARLDAIRHGR